MHRGRCVLTKRMVAPTKFWKATKRAFAIQRGYGLLWPLSELSAAHGLRAVWVDLDNRHGLERQLRALEAWMGADGTHAAFGDMGLGSHLVDEKSPHCAGWWGGF